MDVTQGLGPPELPGTEGFFCPLESNTTQDFLYLILNSSDDIMPLTRDEVLNRCDKKIQHEIISIVSS